MWLVVAIEQLPIEVVLGDVQQNASIATGIDQVVAAGLGTQVHVREEAQNLDVERQTERSVLTMVFRPGRDRDFIVADSNNADFDEGAACFA